MPGPPVLPSPRTHLRRPAPRTFFRRLTLRTRSRRLALPAALLLLAVPPPETFAQEEPPITPAGVPELEPRPDTMEAGPNTAEARPDTIPSDTYGDRATRILVERGRAVRSDGARGLESYEARVWERVWIGLAGSRFRRERTAFSGERAAQVRWDGEGERVVRWEGARQAVPLAGVRSDEDLGLAESLAESLAQLTGGPSAVLYEPGDDRIVFGGDDGALHPLSDSAAAHYRYHPGDTLEITLPPDGRRVTLAEVLVEPRRPEFRLVAGSLWFDVERGDLVRAAFRPARPLTVTAELGGVRGLGLARVLGPLRTMEVEIRQVSVDYTLHEMEWWLPHRYVITVEARAGRLLTIPVTMEWRMGEYRVNTAPSPELIMDPVAEGWSRHEATVPRGGWRAPGSDSVTVVTLVPDPAGLHRSPVLRLPEGEWTVHGTPSLFPREDLEALRERLDQVLPPASVRAPALFWGLDAGLTRYNRVEGLSTGVAWVVPVPLTIRGRGVSARGEGRMGSADRVPGGELRLQRGGGDANERVAVYRRLSHASDWEDPLGLAASASALISGGDQGEYHRTHGGELVATARSRGGEVRLRLFGEVHQSAERETHFHLRRLLGNDTLRMNRPAQEGTWYGGSLGLRGHRGGDPAGWRSFGTVRGEVAAGEDGWYQRAHLTGGVTRGLGPVAGAVEGGAGAGWGTLPPQRSFHLGGPSTIRGIRPSSLVGESFWFLRGEVARPASAVRVALFGDLGWAGAREDWGSGRPIRTLGLGVSFLDGFVRWDLARQLGPDPRWYLHFHMDGLL